MTFSLDAAPGDPYLAGFRLDLSLALQPGSAQQPASILDEAEAGLGELPAPVQRLHAWRAAARGAGIPAALPWPGHMDDLSRMEQLVALPAQSPAAILFNEQDLRLLEHDPDGGDFSYLRHLFVFHRALARLGIQADVVTPEVDLRPYLLVLAPTLYRVDDALAQKLNGFARWGGTVLLGVRTGVQAAPAGRAEGPQPGPLRYLAGSTVTGWQALPPGQGWGIESSLPGLEGPAAVWAEALKEPLGACKGEAGGAQIYRCLARYTSGPFAGQVALGAHAFGLGQACCLGWFPALPQAEAVAAFLAGESGVASIPGLPDGVIALRHESSLLLLNYTASIQTVETGGRAVQVGALDIALLPG